LQHPDAKAEVLGPPVESQSTKNEQGYSGNDFVARWSKRHANQAHCSSSVLLFFAMFHPDMDGIKKRRGFEEL
jgi:hypothetical protein